MLRIVWGVIFILAGLSLVGQAIFVAAISQAVSESGLGSNITSSQTGLLLSFLFGIALGFVGSIMVHSGDKARIECLTEPLHLNLEQPNEQPNKGQNW